MGVKYVRVSTAGQGRGKPEGWQHWKNLTLK